MKIKSSVHPDAHLAPLVLRRLKITGHDPFLLHQSRFLRLFQPFVLDDAVQGESKRQIGFEELTNQWLGDRGHSVFDARPETIEIEIGIGRLLLCCYLCYLCAYLNTQFLVIWSFSSFLRFASSNGMEAFRTMNRMTPRDQTSAIFGL